MKKDTSWMEHSKWRAIASVLVLLGVSLPAVAQDRSAVAPVVGGPETPHLRVPDSFFTENAGQVPNEQVRFYSSGDMQAGFAESAVLVKLVERDHARPLHDFEDGMRGSQVQRDDPPSSRGVMARITFDGSNRVTPQGVQEIPHRSNYFIGNDPSKWRTGVRSYREIVYSDLYDGIDLSYRTQEGRLKYEFILDPGADPALITVSYEGVEDLRLDRSGELIAHTALGEVRDGKPIAYQDGREVECAFIQRGPLSFGFSCEGHNHSRPLVIDPLVYATFLGGGSDDRGYGIAVNSSGSAYVTGYTGSADFPATPGSFDATLNGSGDAFVARLDAAGSALVYATFLGGGGDDWGFGIAVNSSGSAYVTGGTRSADFPATPGSFDATLNGGYDIFVARLDAAGSALVYATFLGGGSDDRGYGIAIDSSGSAYVTGYTWSADFPATSGAFDTSPNGLSDAFVVKLSSASISPPVLSATDEPNYVTDGLDPETGTAGVTSFVYRVNYTDADNDAPLAGDPKLHVLKGGSEITGSPFTMIVVDPADTTYTDGKLYTFATTLSTCGSDYSYYFTASDSTGNPATNWPSPPPDLPDVPCPNNPPVLSATGQPNYVSDGLDPETGTAGVTSFVYRVNYTDADNDSPLAGDPKVHVLKGGVEITGSPVTMTFLSWIGAPDDYVGGALYGYSTTLAVCGNDYSYYFTASDSQGAAAASWPSQLPNLPDVPCPNNPPTLAATDEPNYVTDGLDPETGTAGVTSFVYRVNYTDADNDAPLAGDPKLHVLKGGSEITGSPFTMIVVDPADTTYTDGKLYTFATTLSTCGSDYSYYFTASDSQGAAAASWPSQPPNLPDVPCPNNPPVLDWSGEANYTSDGLNPEEGQNDTTSFVYRVKYSDADNDTPALGHPKLHLQKPCGTDIAGGPFAMTFSSWAGAPGDYAAGAVYEYSTTIAVPGTDYGYYFQANDGTVDVTLPATGCVDAPDVIAPAVNHPPVADAGGPYTCRAGESITLDGSGSTDPDDDVLTYQWTVHLTPVVTLSGQKPTFACPATEGTFRVGLTVNDSGGLSDTDDAQLSIQPERGVAADWTWLIIVAIAVVAVLLILFLLLRRKRRGEETPEAPPTAPSQPPKA